MTSVGGTALSTTPPTPRLDRERLEDQQHRGHRLRLLRSTSAKPTWQTDTGCAKRTVADVSAVADPATGVAVYDTYGEPAGQSTAAPAPPPRSSPPSTPSPGTAGGQRPTPTPTPTPTPSALNDVTTGTNGTCAPAYLCTAGPGYDGPTGLGTPNGLAAFPAGPHGVIAGTVTNAATGTPIAGASVVTPARLGADRLVRPLHHRSGRPAPTT